MNDREFSLPIVGTAHPNADGSNRMFFVRACAPGQPLELRPEPKNKHDPFAIAVHDQRGAQLGYLPADRAPWIGSKMRAGPVAVIFQGEAPAGPVLRIRIGEGTPTLPPPPPAAHVEPDDWDAVDPDGPEFGA